MFCCCFGEKEWNWAKQKRILILGCGGAGKSTLARRLGAATGLPVVHLDGLYWQPGWVAMERAAWRRTVENEIAKDAWIIDGNFGSSLELRLSRAQAAVLLDYSRAVCLAGVLRRVWTTHGRVRPDMGAVPGAVRPELSALGAGTSRSDGAACEGAAGCAPGGEVRHTEKPAGRAKCSCGGWRGRMMEAYKTIQGAARIEEKKSEFIAHAAFADTEEKALAFFERDTGKAPYGQPQCLRIHSAGRRAHALFRRRGAGQDLRPAHVGGHPPRGPCGLHRCDDALFRRYAVGHWRAGARLYSGGKRRSGGGKAGDGTGVRAGRLRVEYPLYELAQRLLADAGAQLEEVQFADRVMLPFVMLAGGETQFAEIAGALPGQRGYYVFQTLFCPF